MGSECVDEKCLEISISSETTMDMESTETNFDRTSFQLPNDIFHKRKAIFHR